MMIFLKTIGTDKTIIASSLLEGVASLSSLQATSRSNGESATKLNILYLGQSRSRLFIGTGDCRFCDCFCSCLKN